MWVWDTIIILSVLIENNPLNIGRVITFKCSLSYEVGGLEMTQQTAYFNANDYYKKRLFVDNGSAFIEVHARIIEPYSPPEPQIKLKENKIISGPSDIHGRGNAYYKAKIKLLFYNRTSYSEYLLYCYNIHKFYDEKGSIFLGSVNSMTRTAFEASKKYTVELEMFFVKKDMYEKKHRAQFLDLVDVSTGESLWFYNDVQEMADLGLVSVINRDGSPVLYFNGDDPVSRAEFIAFLNRTRRWLERKIKE